MKPPTIKYVALKPILILSSHVSSRFFRHLFPSAFPSTSCAPRHSTPSTGTQNPFGDYEFRSFFYCNFLYHSFSCFLLLCPNINTRDQCFSIEVSGECQKQVRLPLFASHKLPSAFNIASRSHITRTIGVGPHVPTTQY